MSKYIVTFLEGTQNYVIEELNEKFPNIENVKEGGNEISFESKIADIEAFRGLLSPLSIVDGIGRRVDLSKREWRKEYIPAGINPSLAYIMCVIAQLREQDILYDPFCGSGIIPITGLKYFSTKRVICSDISGSAIEKSRRNFTNAGIEQSKYKLFRSDIRDVKLVKRNVDVIISNLPFGIRVGNHEENIELYVALEKVSQRVLRKMGRLILLTQEKNLLREVFKEGGWDVKSVLRVNQGGLLPEVFVIRRGTSN